MKLILSSMLALAIAGFPLRVQEPDDKGKPRQEEPKKPQKAESPQQPDEQPKPKPEKPPKQEPSPSPKQQPPKQQPDDKQREKQQKQKEQAKPEKNRQQEQTQTTRPGDTRQPAPAKGQRIPPEKFRASFGREHHFRVARGGGDHRRFQYSGYWFEVVEVWPAGWSFEDDCYIEENGDDYYLVDVVHPEIRVLVIVVSA